VLLIRCCCLTLLHVVTHCELPVVKTRCQTEDVPVVRANFFCLSRCAVLFGEALHRRRDGAVMGRCEIQLAIAVVVFFSSKQAGQRALPRQRVLGQAFRK
jgi:hypothetical protein